jgi:preprotein translocase subunit SecE
VARDRKRAKQRRAREERRSGQGARRAASRQEGPLAVERRPTTQPPEPVEEASGDAELAKEAARGAPTDEVDHPVDDPDAKAEVYEDELSDEAGGGVLSDLVDRDEELGLEDEPDSELEPEVPAADGREPDSDAAAVALGRKPAGKDAPTPARRQRREVERRQGNRVIAFLRACWAELQRVQWPDRRQVGQATAVVLGFVVIAGSYLGLMDFIWQKVVTALLDL